MSVNYKDLIDGNNALLTRTGWQLTRIAIVSGATGTGHSKILDAFNRLGDNIGDQHPSLPTAYLMNISPMSISSDTVKFRLDYAEYPFADTVVSIGSTVSQIEANKDVNDEVFELEYTYPSDYHISDYASETITTGAVIALYAPETLMTVRKHITGTNYLEVVNYSRDYVGKTNMSGWLIHPTSPENTWLCTGITGETDDGGLTYLVTYSFHYREEGWDSEIVYMDPNTGKPPSDVVDDVGIKTYQMYETANFNNLYL